MLTVRHGKSSDLAAVRRRKVGDPERSSAAPRPCCTRSSKSRRRVRSVITGLQNDIEEIETEVFCTQREYWLFLRQCLVFERLLVEDDLLLWKYWFSISQFEQERRLRKRVGDPMRRWKLSPIDLESVSRWQEYSRARDEMLAATDTPEEPWYLVESEDRRRGRINMIAHLLSSVTHYEVPRLQMDLPARPQPGDYERPSWENCTHVPDHAASL
jgi:hypothetical protein